MGWLDRFRRCDETHFLHHWSLHQVDPESGRVWSQCLRCGKIHWGGEN